MKPICEHCWERGDKAIGKVAQLEDDNAALKQQIELEAIVSGLVQDENATLKLAVQAAIDYFTDGITSKEQYDAYLRFVDAAQPFFDASRNTQESE